MLNCERYPKKDHDFKFVCFLIQKHLGRGAQSLYALYGCTKCTKQEKILIQEDQEEAMIKPENAPIAYIE